MVLVALKSLMQFTGVPATLPLSSFIKTAVCFSVSGFGVLPTCPHAATSVTGKAKTANLRMCIDFLRFQRLHSISIE
jgi:hypothetical protein